MVTAQVSALGLPRLGVALLGTHASIRVYGSDGGLSRGENLPELPAFCRGILTHLSR